MVPDAEVIEVVREILDKFDIKYTIKFNHKALLDLILDLCNVPKDKYNTTCSSIDKLDKEPWENVQVELLAKGLSEEIVHSIKQHILLSGEPLVVLEILQTRYTDLKFVKILDEIKLLFSYLESFDCLKMLTFDLSLARGLSYYTGVIFEAILLDNEIGVGSLAAGGRYDGLIGMFSSKQIPSVGGSIGIERLFTIMQARNKVAENKSQTQVYITHIGGDDMMKESFKLCKKLWENGIVTEFPYKKQKKMADKIQTVLDNGIPYMILVAGDEFKRGEVCVKDIVANKQSVVKLDEVVEYIKSKFQ